MEPSHWITHADQHNAVWRLPEGNAQGHVKNSSDERTHCRIWSVSWIEVVQMRVWSVHACVCVEHRNWTQQDPARTQNWEKASLRETSLGSVWLSWIIRSKEIISKSRVEMRDAGWGTPWFAILSSEGFPSVDGSEGNVLVRGWWGQMFLFSVCRRETDLERALHWVLAHRKVERERLECFYCISGKLLETNCGELQPVSYRKRESMLYFYKPAKVIK